MSTSKVYLAKSPLASGLDVEYVKSNLTRVPNIQIVEFGMGIQPEDCESLVVVLGSNKDSQEIEIDQRLFSIIDDFICNSENDDAISNIYIYAGKNASYEYASDDVEDTTPVYYSLEDWEEDEDPETGETIYRIVRDDSTGSLLTSVSIDINGHFSGWENIPRHYTPEDKYAMPAPPPVEARRAKSLHVVNTITESKVSQVTDTKNVLILRRRRN